MKHAVPVAQVLTDGGRAERPEITFSIPTLLGAAGHAEPEVGVTPCDGTAKAAGEMPQAERKLALGIVVHVTPAGGTDEGPKRAATPRGSVEPAFAP